MPVRIQCVLFIKHSEDTTGSESFALLPPEFLDHPACAVFSKLNIQVISNSQVKVNKNAHFRVIETFLDELKSNAVSSTQKVSLYVNVCDNKFAQRELSRYNLIKIVTRFRATKIHSCVDGKNLPVIEQFLKAGATYKYKSDDFKGTLIHFAADKGYVALLELILKHGADINTKTSGPPKKMCYSMENGFTPLHVAAMRANLTIAELLLKHGADINCRCVGASTPLHLAVGQSSLEMVQFLVEKGADYEAKRHDNFTPLHMAAHANSYQNVKYLLERGANPSCTIDGSFYLQAYGATPLHLAVKGKRLETVKVLVENGADINAQYPVQSILSVLYFAIRYGHIYSIEYILSRHPDVNTVGNQAAFQLAFSKTAEHMKIAVEKMLEVGFTIDRKHKNEPDFLFGAIYKNMFEIVEKLLDFGANINEVHSFKSQKLTPLHLAVLHPNTRMIQLLLDRGANVNAVRDCSYTPLLDAIEKGDTALFKLLLSNGANINLDDPNPLISIIKRSPKDPKILELLLLNGADANFKTTSEGTPLSTAIYKGDLEVMELLIKFGGCFSFEHIAGFTIGNVQLLQAVLDFGFILPKPTDESEMKRIFEYYDWWSEINRHRDYKLPAYGECAKIFASHVLKIDAARESVDMRPLVPTAVFELFDSNDFLSRCKAEVSLMKSTKIGRTNVTFYETLTKADAISFYSRNEEFVVKFESYDIEKKFPIYGSILKCLFRQGTQRRTLLKTAIKMLKSLFSQFSSLPDEIKENIVELLNNQDILILKTCLNMK